MMRNLAAFLFAALLAFPAFADMYQDASNASLPAAMNKLASQGIMTPLWVHAGTGTITYAGGPTIQASNAFGQPAYYGETRSAGTTGGGTIASYNVVYADHPSVKIPTWAGYDECNVKTGAYQPACIAREISLHSEIAAVQLSPYVSNDTGHTIGLRVDSGKGGVLGTSQNISVLLHLMDNGGRAVNGILFSKDALVSTNGSGGAGVAMEMATGQTVRWLGPGGATQAEVWGDANGYNVKTNMRLTGDLYLSGNMFARFQAGGNRIFDGTGLEAMTLGSGYNFHANGQHIFANVGGGTTYATIDSHGLIVPAMPTSCAASVSKGLWNNAGVVNICP